MSGFSDGPYCPLCGARLPEHKETCLHYIEPGDRPLPTFKRVVATPALAMEALALISHLDEMIDLGEMFYDLKEKELLDYDGPKVRAWGRDASRLQEILRQVRQ